ncbi:MAG TPA: ABC transporter [Nitrospiraceae bacterium]|nr:ABC transporter [Nitrospiraceae bacterium]
MIRVSGLTKYYGDKCVVDSVSFEIAKGEVFGLLGPNGAGKTTIIKMLTTLSKPSSGDIRFNNIDAVKNPDGIKRMIGVVPQEKNFDMELSVYENMLIYGMFYSINGLRRKIEETLTLLRILDYQNSSINALSCGMQRRLLIARALLSAPDVLFMDEPTIGLDPQIRRDLWDIIGAIQDSGTTVFLTTHYMEEAEAMCDVVGILLRGRLIAIDTPSALKRTVGSSNFEDAFIELTGEAI